MQCHWKMRNCYLNLQNVSIDNPMHPFAVWMHCCLKVQKEDHHTGREEVFQPSSITDSHKYSGLIRSRASMDDGSQLFHTSPVSAFMDLVDNIIPLYHLIVGSSLIIHSSLGQYVRNKQLIRFLTFSSDNCVIQGYFNQNNTNLKTRSYLPIS